jgi:O-methyltransferase
VGVLGITKAVIKSAFHRLGLDISRYQPQQHRYAKNLLYEADPLFQKFYAEGVKNSGTPDSQAVAPFSKRQERFYNLVQVLIQTLPLEGKLIECGCWKGLSSYIICNYLRQRNPSFQGADMVIVDSFAGLSEPTQLDQITDVSVAGKVIASGQPAGAFAATLEEVKQTLVDFPAVTYFQGWIPAIFEKLPEAQYKFVHIDVDLYEPVHHSIAYFYPRLVTGGVIVFDDYGSLYWPGAKKAVDDYCAAQQLSLLCLSTGQALLWKKP